MYRMTGRLLVMMALAIVLVAGCGSDEATDPDLQFNGEIEPETPEILLMNFQTAYETRDAARLLALMSDDHVTILQASTVAQFPDLGPTLDQGEEALIHQRMFSGQNVTDPEGSLIPAVESIEFQTFARQGSWTLSLPTDPIPDTTCAIYDVVVLLSRGSSHSTLKVQGAIKIYVEPYDSTSGGRTRTLYRLRGQWDLTTDGLKTANSESTSWGTVKALFRATAP